MFLKCRVGREMDLERCTWRDRASVIGDSRNEFAALMVASSFSFQQSECHWRNLMRDLLDEANTRA